MLSKYYMKRNIAWMVKNRVKSLLRRYNSSIVYYKNDSDYCIFNLIKGEIDTNMDNFTRLKDCDFDKYCLEKCANCEKLVMNDTLVRHYGYAIKVCKDSNQCIRNKNYTGMSKLGSLEKFKNIEYYLEVNKETRKIYINGLDFFEAYGKYIKSIPVSSKVSTYINELFGDEYDTPLHTDTFLNSDNTKYNKINRFKLNDKQVLKDTQDLLSILNCKGGIETLFQAFNYRLHRYIPLELGEVFYHFNTDNGQLLETIKEVKNLFGLVAMSIIFSSWNNV